MTERENNTRQKWGRSPLVELPRYADAANTEISELLESSRREVQVELCAPNAAVSHRHRNRLALVYKNTLE